VQSDFLWSEEYPNSPPELVELTGLTDDILSEFGIHPVVALKKLLALMEKADYIVAHNGNEFDKLVLEEELKRYGSNMPSKPWIDTKTDVPYPKRIKTTKLSYLCAEHGFANNTAHRALFDTQAMLRVLSQYNFDDVVALAKQPTVYAIANVSFQEKHLARDRGYYWNPDAKKWYKAMKESAAIEEKNSAPFEVEIKTNK
jgi:DNA polymerase-3 subunit epsilon